ncbi:hypothetical protein [Riemerella anatipestifer]|uniref:Uncharacterized protein n=1 Tax=Riemerella anatipestifer RA-CH-1 TaxID=1228997 RepID=J9R983_RIEAN|nr:hypothetical protein [Riemerella anatipestifer]AFR36237.1 hypothetical protein B739_1645 [Riemerella anatipestifer RA-CH-1]MCO7331989.1 hypothetical protein [Riemerella anatipestifer]MCO7350876.1 hypothetical protein [Riemerella anatipestifer]MCU7582385.1 hypothetical protein [Riemerella anatipestifer]MSN88230.1 hypothetical protein [Riemerella anatipestifer]
MANLNEIEKLVSVKYEDLTGVVKMDLHGNISSLYEFCEEKGICLKNKFLIGLRLEDMNTLELTGEEIYLSILYVANDEGLSYDEIRSKLLSNKNIEIKKESLYIKLSELLSIIKRLDFMVTTPITDDLSMTLES